ncbi:hypothetical protein [Haloarchaeobius sp. DYHT-AS-18]|uniref:hypothetical protein n=1 Tax=Haloarchaeobius sp. DYHT-AS-18 TaxID=3446117 RepID=UPI003EBAA29B
MTHPASPARRALAGLVLAGGLLVAASRLLAARVTDVPLCPLTARGRIGSNWVARSGVGTGEELPGEMDDLGTFARPDFDPALVAPEVRKFYEQTSQYDLALTAEWHRPFRTGAWLASLLTGALEQLNLPAPGDSRVRHLTNHLERLDPAADPREGARAWVRTDRDTGEGVFTAMYATHVRGDERFVNIGVPLPFTNLSTVLSIRHLGDAGAVELVSDTDGGPGLYLVTPVGTFELPMKQRFRVWPVDAPGAPPALDGNASVVATHEMWVFGRQFLTVRYAGVTAADDPE